MAAIAQKEELKIKKNFGREALINAGGNRSDIVEVLDEYDQEEMGEETEISSTDKETVVATKAAKWRLQLEIKKEQHHREQLRLSQSKQVLCMCLLLIV